MDAPGRMKTVFALAGSLWIVDMIIRAATAEALQVHAAPEGLYVHQLTHAFFVISMAILVFWLQKSRLVLKKGWRYFQIGCLFFIFWNVDAMVGHLLESGLSMNAFVGTGWTKALAVNHNIFHVLYYLLKLDHLLCVPAMAFMYLGLNRLAAGSKGN